MSMSPSLQSAREKFLEESKRGPPFPLEELPKDRTDPLWTAIARQYNLSLVEQSALKNFVCPSTRPDNNKDKSHVDSEINISRSSLEELAAILQNFGASAPTKIDSHDDAYEVSSVAHQFECVSLHYLFKAAQNCQANYSNAEGLQILYYIRSKEWQADYYFLSYERALEFIHDLNEATMKDINYIESSYGYTPPKVKKPTDLQAIVVQHIQAALKDE